MCRMRQSLLLMPICFLLLPHSWGQGRQEPTKPHLNIGTIGHAGHGKTTLTAAITKVLHQRFPRVQQRSFESIDNPPQQKKRGIAIAAGQVEYETANRHYAHTDCSSQADCIKAIITGAVPMDGAILVVSAADGPMLQTDQQVALARQAGIAALVVYLNKTDMVDKPGQRERVEKAVRELLSRHGFPGHETPVIAGSALKALQGDQDAQDSILKLLEAIDSHLPLPRRAVDKPFLMPIQDISSISGRGTLLKGRIERGRIQVGQEVEIAGIRPASKWVVSGLERLGKLLDQGQAGDEMGLLLRGLGRNVERGQVVAAPGSVTAHSRFLAAAYFLTQQEGGRRTPFFSGYRPQFYIRSAAVTGTVQLPEGTEMVMPGDHLEFTATLVAPIPMEKGLRFVVREGRRIVGAGTVSMILD